jgi:hypothetical protein
MIALLRLAAHPIAIVTTVMVAFLATTAAGR